MSATISDEYSLPNTQRLQRTLEIKKNSAEACLTDKEWQKSYLRCRMQGFSKASLDNRLNNEKIDLEISTNILELCAKREKNKPIYVTKEQWNWVDRCFLKEHGERECVCCKKIKSLSEILNTSHLCKECEDKGLTTRCNICGEWRPIVGSVSNLEFCKECKEEANDVYRDYTCLLPNSKWLREMLKWIIEACLGEDIATKILNQCDKIGEGKSVSLTITDAHCLYSNLEYCRRYPPFDACHSDYKDYCKYGSTFAKWHQSMDKYMKLLEDELNLPSVPPIISEREWKICNKVGFIDGEDGDIPCPICDEPINQYHTKHKDHEIHFELRCLRCDKEIERYHTRLSLTLDNEQRKCMSYSLRNEIYNIVLDFNADRVPEQYQPREEIALKLRKNALHKLNSSGCRRISFDPYTIVTLRHSCDFHIKAEEDLLKGSSDREEWGKMMDVLSGIREMVDTSVLPQMAEPLCYQCIEREGV